ncbi:MAG: hypothetical protein VXY81_14760, partial [Pseudomonadota bacterium]|nr:hypothetical protein [Pseudomonadota bacterium]
MDAARVDAGLDLATCVPRQTVVAEEMFFAADAAGARRGGGGGVAAWGTLVVDEGHRLRDEG